ncbi:hypothetical protein, partial [Streptomyces sp. NPDC002790]|uniref:hypothetical protein n=1 Tax=Streptomyces sp. NPDC002790 TaxID=3154431 RepID=UPI0033318CEB
GLDTRIRPSRAVTRSASPVTPLPAGSSPPLPQRRLLVEQAAVARALLARPGHVEGAPEPEENPPPWIQNITGQRTSDGPVGEGLREIAPAAGRTLHVWVAHVQ